MIVRLQMLPGVDILIEQTLASLRRVLPACAPQRRWTKPLIYTVIWSIDI